MSFGVENICKEKSAELKNLISLIKTPQQIIDSFKHRLSYIEPGLKRIIQNNMKIAFRDLMSLFGKLKIPHDLIRLKKLKINNFTKDLDSSIKREFIKNKEKYNNFLRLIETNSVQSNLKKGYSILSKKNKIINSSKLIKENDTLSARLIDKIIEIKVKKIN